MDQLSPESIVMRVSHFVLWVFQAVFVIKDSFFYADLTQIVYEVYRCLACL
ncbi:hypothetical protein CAT59_15745 [Acinetobacter pittii]|jgi:hypothetical protein|uniref:Uncharacterized protein n=1 Tax=Acinetobacter pittii TaxID=48296 RepID=A0A242U0T8_ACIPI|nr:hypothetical protein CAT59_15745 [Acinetobacter pittii]PPC07779.1 hypothetical protein ApiMCR8900_01740 [Acinetobacter pittii]